jgi:hypothetical protein
MLKNFSRTLLGEAKLVLLIEISMVYNAMEAVDDDRDLSF